MGDVKDRIEALVTDTKFGALANLREDVWSQLNEGTPRSLADLLFDLLEGAMTRDAAFAKDTYLSARLSRSSAATQLKSSVESGTFKNAVQRFEQVLGACRPHNYSLMPAAEDRIGVACIEATINGELRLLIVRGPTSTARGATQPDSLLRLIAEFRPLASPQSTVFHWNLPQTRNFVFTGRDDCFVALDAPGDTPASPRVDVLVGLGGVGKSHICIEFAHRHRDAFDVIWWIRASHSTTILEDVRALAVDLGIAEADATTPDAVTRARSWLEHNDRWLLIVDNAECADSVQMFLPRRGSGRVLVTSLNPSWQTLGRVHEIDVLSEPLAALFLELRSGHVDDRNEVLASELGCLPLALEHAAAYIEATGLSCAGYLELYRRNHTSLLRSTGSHLSPVVVTWLISLGRVQSQNKLAVRLLNMVSHLAPAPIPRVVLETWVTEDAGATSLHLNDAIAALRRYSLITTHATNITVHRLLQDVVRASQKKDERRILRSTTLRLVHDLFASQTFAFHVSGLAPLLLPHVHAVITPDRVASSDLAIHSLVLLYGYLDQRGRFDELPAMLNEAARRARSSTGAHIRLSVFSKLAGVQWALKNPTAAFAALDSAMKIAEHFHPSTAGDFASEVEFLYTAADLAAGLGRLEDALRFLEQAITVIRQVQLEPGMAARTYSSMGEVLSQLARHDEAIGCLELAVALDRQMFGNSHPAVALRLRALGEAYDAATRLREARLAFEEALDITLTAYGDEHTMTFINFVNLGGALRKQGDYLAALAMYDRAILNLGTSPMEWRAELREGRARTLGALGRYDGALADIDQAIALAEAAGFQGQFMERLHDCRNNITGMQGA